MPQATPTPITRARAKRKEWIEFFFASLDSRAAAQPHSPLPQGSEHSQGTLQCHACAAALTWQSWTGSASGAPRCAQAPLLSSCGGQLQLQGGWRVVAWRASKTEPSVTRSCVFSMRACLATEMTVRGVMGTMPLGTCFVASFLLTYFGSKQRAWPLFCQQHTEACRRFKTARAKEGGRGARGDALLGSRGGRVIDPRHTRVWQCGESGRDSRVLTVGLLS